jgi:hypothetical protein
MRFGWTAQHVAQHGIAPLSGFGLGIFVITQIGHERATY